MLKFILPLTVLCGSLSAVNLRNPEQVVHADQYKLLAVYSQTFPDELHLLIIYDIENDLYGCYVVSYFDKCLYEFNFRQIVAEYELIPYEYVKDLKELKYITEYDYGFIDSASL